MSTTYAGHELIEQLAAARRARGLSQRELGERTGAPQSYISRIEKGMTDVRLSNLIELARALDLEVALVPRKSVPAVESVVRQTLPPEGDRTAQALDVIHKTTDVLRTVEAANRLAQVALPSDALAKLNDSLKRVGVFRYDTDHLRRLQEATKPVLQLQRLLEQNSPAAALERVASSAKHLIRLRNEMAHPEALALPKPAYSLDEDDDA